MPSQADFQQLLVKAGLKVVNSKELYPALHAETDAGLPMLVVENRLARAVIALQGAHVMAFRPTGQREMLWVSPKCVLADGMPIRGGIPLCLPWFGPGPDGKSMHGFARTLPWMLSDAETLPTGATRLVFELAGDETTSTLWPHAYAFRFEMLIGEDLKLDMTVNNRSAQTAPLAFAFHTYFSVSDVAKVRVSGLSGNTYIDKTDNFARKSQQGDVTISAVTDRIYLDVADRQTVEAPEGRFQIDSKAKCAVVWNAWSNDKNVPDLGEGNHVGYICVERGDVAERAPQLAAGGQYRTAMTLSF